MEKNKILIVDDEKQVRNITEKILSEKGFVVKSAENGMKALETVISFKPSVILLDQCLPDLGGIEVMQKIENQLPETMIIIITAYGAVDKAVDAIKKGAYDYIEKPFDNEKLIALTRNALNHSRLLYENKQLKKQVNKQYDFSNIIGISNKMRFVFDQVQAVCDTDASVLILGESGVGKELVARSIHYNSEKKEHPFVGVNCGAIPMELMESELFGHEKGAFTDAKTMKKGRFEQANNGTLFLDEIGELKLEAQVKLLRVLEEKRITRLGGKQSIPVDVRIISATNSNLDERVKNNQFRLDLYYRLNIFTIRIPPLRERQEDIPSLVGHFIKKYNKELSLNINNVSHEAMEILINYEWPGNIRDIENAVQSAMIMAKEGNIQKKHIPLRCKGYANIESDSDNLYKGLAQKSNEINDQAEREMLLNVLQKCNYKRGKTAEHLKISRKTLYNKMKKYNLI